MKGPRARERVFHLRGDAVAVAEEEREQQRRRGVAEPVRGTLNGGPRARARPSNGRREPRALDGAGAEHEGHQRVVRPRQRPARRQPLAGGHPVRLRQQQARSPARGRGGGTVPADRALQADEDDRAAAAGGPRVLERGGCHASDRCRGQPGMRAPRGERKGQGQQAARGEAVSCGRGRAAGGARQGHAACGHQRAAAERRKRGQQPAARPQERGQGGRCRQNRRRDPSLYHFKLLIASLAACLTRRCSPGTGHRRGSRRRPCRRGA